jgi:hypothetical protein
MNGRKMNKVKSLLFVSCAVLFSLAGCAETRRYETVEKICPPNVEKQQTMKIAEEVLGGMNFTVDKADAELGFIRTRPLTGAQWFEFWRSDNVGSFNSAEANLHSIRRIVELNISRQNGRQCIGCNVKVQRLNLPEDQVSSSSQAYRMFSESSPSKQKLKLHLEQKKGMAWVDLGNDTRLATEILKRIEDKINRLQEKKSL